MSFLFAFIIAGLVGLVGQLIFLAARKNMIVALIVMFAVGAVATLSGLAASINALAAGALPGMLMNGGGAFARSLYMIINDGDASLFIIMWVVIALIALCGTISGAIKMSIDAKKEQESC